MTEFHAGLAPKGFKKDFESFLFNTKEHRLTQSKKGWKEFHLIDRKKKKILASISFHIQGEKARSPFRAPFGSIETASQLNSCEISKFISKIDDGLLSFGVREVEIVNPSEQYVKNHNSIVAALIYQNYTPSSCDLSCGIKVDNIHLVDKMSKGKRRQSGHSQKMGFIFKGIPITKINEVYQFIENCRIERSQTLSLTLQELKKILKSLSQSFKIFGIFFKKELVAASICVSVNKNIVYTFYSAHKSSYDSNSPLTILLSNLYDWCFENGITLLDLGTSTLNRKPNFNLLDYKLRVGGTISPKITFQKKLR